MAGAPGSDGRKVGAGERISADERRRFSCLGIGRRIDQRNAASTDLSCPWIAWRRLSVQRQPQDLAYRLIGILRGREALAIAHGEEERFAVRRKKRSGRRPAALARGHLAPQHLEVIQPRLIAVQYQLTSPPWPGRRHSHRARHR